MKSAPIKTSSIEIKSEHHEMLNALIEYLRVTQDAAQTLKVKLESLNRTA